MLKKIPLADAYKTTLAQPLASGDGAGAYIYCGSVPAITFPAGFTTSLRINGGNSLSEEIEVDQVDVPNKRWRIKSRNLSQGAGIATSAQAHQTGAEVILSDSYAFWKDIADAINNYDGPFVTYADDAARDAAIPSPLPFQVCGNTAAGCAQIFVGGNWEDLATGDDEATTRSCTQAAANVGELFRDSANSNQLTYKNESGTSYQLLLDASGQINPSLLVGNLLGTGADGALVVTSGTTNLNLGQVYNFSSISISAGATLSSAGTGAPLILKCSGTAAIEGTIDLAGKNVSLLSSVLTGKTATPGANGAGGAGGRGAVPGSASWLGTAGTGSALGYGGGGSGGAALNNATPNNNVGNGGNGGTPGGTGGTGSAAGGDAYGLAGADAANPGGTVNGTAGGASAGGGAAGVNYASGGGGGAGGNVGAYGGGLILYAASFSGSGTINLNGGTGGSGGKGGSGTWFSGAALPAGGGGGGAGGAGGGGGGGTGIIVGLSNSFGGTVTASGGAAGTAGTGGSTTATDGSIVSGENGSAGTSGAAGTVFNQPYTY